MTEEQIDSPAPPPSPYQVLPKYPELIFDAIAAVDEKNGANKSAISRQIEATYGSLPAAHSTLLSHHLNKMKASGELIIVKNNYVKPDPDAPPKRGRGRPAKPKEPLPEGTVVSPPRPRGRPPKPVDPNAPVSTPRPRGRPPKPVDPNAPVSTPRPRGRPSTPRDPNAPVSTPRPRGRPPKGQVALAKSSSSSKPRGRPRKVQDPLATNSSTDATAVSPARPRGRPPNSSPKKATPSVSGRKRGRPSKSVGASKVASPPPSGERRGRGRPPKMKKTEADPVKNEV